MSDKSTGSYYTPKVLVRHMIQSIRGRVCFDSVLEPSCGDGRFLDELIEYSQRILAIELDPKKVKILKYLNNGNMTIECADFIYYSLCHNEQYSLIIGNPPYISKKSVDENQRKLSTELLKLFKQPESIFQNLWVSFILGSLKLLSDNGTIFFVLPFEFLQVQYAEKLRVFLEEKFNTIEITTFQEQVFSDIEQDVCLVLMCNEKNAKPFIKYTTLKSIQNPEVVFQSVIMRNKPLKKWSNCILNDDETEFLKSMAKKYPQIKKFGEISPGIVTGANSFFILDRNAVNRLAAENFVINIISKSNDVKGYFLFSVEEFNQLADSEKRVYMLNLCSVKEDGFPEGINEYINTGEKEKLNERYKCKERKRWFDVPIIKTGSVCFFKRFHKYPRMIVNTAGVYTTDIAYNIRFHEGFESKSFAFSFYNSLTMALCEYNGRFYGGGVGELVPSEFKELSIPYQKVEENHIIHINDMIREGISFSAVIDYVDSVVLRLPNEEKEKLQSIRNRFLQRRLCENTEEE